MCKLLSFFVILSLSLAVAVAAQAVTIDLVPVGNPGNANDRTKGGVTYNYQIGKFEITAGQYSEFLNAVARTADPYELYNTNMSSYTSISRVWYTDHYFYSTTSAYANRPVNFVSWGDAARFCNWLSNGQPTTGVENLSTTEDGSYYLNGAMSNEAFMAVTRKSNATWVIPSLNEWYKAAYYDPNKPGGAGYWDYPTGTDDISRSRPCLIQIREIMQISTRDGYTIGYPYYRTNVGEFENSASPYGTFDQAGNVSEWSEGVRGVNNGTCVDLGGGFGTPLDDLSSLGIGGGEYPTTEIWFILVFA